LRIGTRQKSQSGWLLCWWKRRSLTSLTPVAGCIQIFIDGCVVLCCVAEVVDLTGVEAGRGFVDDYLLPTVSEVGAGTGGLFTVAQARSIWSADWRSFLTFGVDLVRVHQC